MVSLHLHSCCVYLLYPSQNSHILYSSTPPPLKSTPPPPIKWVRRAAAADDKAVKRRRRPSESRRTGLLWPHHHQELTSAYKHLLTAIALDKMIIYAIKNHCIATSCSRTRTFQNIIGMQVSKQITELVMIYADGMNKRH
jgi:hypothetical protein